MSTSYNYNQPNSSRPSNMLVPGLIAGGVAIFALVMLASLSTSVVGPGQRGVKVTLGKVSPEFVGEGFVFKLPIITTIQEVSVRQLTEELNTECYSADLQQVQASIRVLYRIPENSVVALFRDYQGEPFTDLIAPRVVEAVKEVASSQSAEMIVQNREKIKIDALASLRQKIGLNAAGSPLIVVEDITISDLQLSSELNAAIEQKMTQREEAERAKFVQRQAEIEAETAIIRAKGEAESIEIKGKALRQSPAFILLQVVEQWDGISPLVVGAGGSSGGAQVMVPMSELEKANPAPR